MQLLAGLTIDDVTFVKVGPTVGSLAFAAIIGGGFFLRPSLLERTLGYSLQMTRLGWHVLHRVVDRSVCVSRRLERVGLAKHFGMGMGVVQRSLGFCLAGSVFCADLAGSPRSLARVGVMPTRPR